MKNPLKFLLPAFCTIVALISCAGDHKMITLDTLFEEMTDMSRLSSAKGMDYRVVQYSSYDRRSVSPLDSTWFSNEDGFGGEPIPGFEKVLAAPDSSGTGTYLICDAKGPGVVQRLWTAGISGTVRVYLDSPDNLIFQGKAEDFFRKPVEILLGDSSLGKHTESFYQYDASYFPIPFSKGFRMEWTGKISDIHFYHVGLRLYDNDQEVESFTRENFRKYMASMIRTDSLLRNPDHRPASGHYTSVNGEVRLEPGDKAVLMDLKGPSSITLFRLRADAGNLENALRQAVLRIRFDDSETAQVNAPLGDFFGAAPGINPFKSLPFTVLTDGTMICRFEMPFSKNARIIIENHSAEKIKVSAEAIVARFRWKDGESMHFHALWSMDHDLTTSELDSRASDIPYLVAEGKGRITGAAALIYNPSGVPTSWGNWWGEGDEKIFIDRDTFPSFFGTGSEDYFNYSWSSSRIFSYPYCGQPRNDGPGNRGYVSDFRWHISDDIPFRESACFLMELKHHGEVEGFSYGRIIYYYLLPGGNTVTGLFTTDDLREINYEPWMPEAFKGSDGWQFTQAEKLVRGKEGFGFEKDDFWAGSGVLNWIPGGKEIVLKLNLYSDREISDTRIGITLTHSPSSGSLTFGLNGEPLRFSGRDTLIVFTASGRLLDNHFSGPVRLKKGSNELMIRMPDADGRKTAQIDFIWLRK
ncbi:MAG TPA: DUF2961 domain-containing protein [Bacteroidales bacterium]|nr:DUF2961 domain-containing protein [Bacteroidales bacterium]